MKEKSELSSHPFIWLPLAMMLLPLASACTQAKMVGADLAEGVKDLPGVLVGGNTSKYESSTGDRIDDSRATTTESIVGENRVRMTSPVWLERSAARSLLDHGERLYGIDIYAAHGHVVERDDPYSLVEACSHGSYRTEILESENEFAAHRVKQKVRQEARERWVALKERNMRVHYVQRVGTSGYDFEHQAFKVHEPGTVVVIPKTSELYGYEPDCEEVALVVRGAEVPKSIPMDMDEAEAQSEMPRDRSGFVLVVSGHITGEAESISYLKDYSKCYAVGCPPTHEVTVDAVQLAVDRAMLLNHTGKAVWQTQ
ncbi:hypothetical protein RM531_09020 [Salinisphaera sp. P385]|uniref:Lipoprotein n=1 Tax=Spectribacter acetivorans TaxID=3075603 RepID=A0ABU3B9B8_9GAMM|nr:hypothetical protein [Salinisphaera sp. P385]MDT0618620.1 hypothetical protein [Salinisphaera sp. P385]